jgi:hypothetical protein
MDEPAASPAPLDRSLACVKCGYELRGLFVAGVCPECGLAVADSLRGWMLAYASPAYRARLERGLTLVLIGIGTWILLSIAGWIVQVTSTRYDMTPVIAIHVATLASTAVSLAGYWWYTEPDPGYTGIEKSGSARRIARTMAVVQAVGAAMNLAGTLLQPRMGPGMTAGDTVMMVGMAGGVLLGYVGFIAQFFAVMLYTRWIGSRIPDARLRRRARAFMWLLPVICVTGAGMMAAAAAMVRAMGVLTIVGVLGGAGLWLVAMALYWCLLNRARRQVRLINKTGVRAALAGVSEAL